MGGDFAPEAAVKGAVMALAAIGPDSTLHAYTSPLSSSATHPTMTYTHLFTTFMFSSIFKKVYILG